MADTLPPHPVHGNTARKVISNTNAGPYMGQVNALSFQAANMARNGVNPVRLKTHSDAGDVSVYRYGGNEIVNINKPAVWDDTEYLVCEFTAYRGRGWVDGVFRQVYSGAAMVWNMKSGTIADIGVTLPCSINDLTYGAWKASMEILVSGAKQYGSVSHGTFVQVPMTEETMTYEQQEWWNETQVPVHVQPVYNYEHHPADEYGEYIVDAAFPSILPAVHDALHYPDDGSLSLPWREADPLVTPWHYRNNGDPYCTLNTIINGTDGNLKNALWQHQKYILWDDQFGNNLPSALAFIDYSRHWFAVTSFSPYGAYGIKKYNSSLGDTVYIRLSNEGVYEWYSVKADPFPSRSWEVGGATYYEYLALPRLYEHNYYKIYGPYGLLSEVETKKHDEVFFDGYNGAEVLGRNVILKDTLWEGDDNSQPDQSGSLTPMAFSAFHINTNKSLVVWSEVQYAKVTESYYFNFSAIATPVNYTRTWSPMVHVVHVGTHFNPSGGVQNDRFPSSKNNALGTAIEATISKAYLLRDSESYALPPPNYKGVIESAIAIFRQPQP
jgi:hypothetical protein